MYDNCNSRPKVAFPAIITLWLVSDFTTGQQDTCVNNFLCDVKMAGRKFDDTMMTQCINNKYRPCQSSQADKIVMHEILFSPPFHPVPPIPPLLFLPLSFLSLCPFLSHLVSSSILRRKAASSSQLGDLSEHCMLLQWGPGQQSPAANAFLRHCELRKGIWWLQFWVTFFCGRSKNFKCRGCGNITRLLTNAWDSKPPAWECEMDLECVSVTLNAWDLIGLPCCW